MDAQTLASQFVKGSFLGMLFFLEEEQDDDEEEEEQEELLLEGFRRSSRLFFCFLPLASVMVSGPGQWGASACKYLRPTYRLWSRWMRCPCQRVCTRKRRLM